MKTANPCSRTRKVNEPHEVWTAPGWQWRVLKKYQGPELEARNPLARWFCAVKGPGTFGSYDLGDTYVRDVVGGGAVRMPDAEVAAHCARSPW